MGARALLLTFVLVVGAVALTAADGRAAPPRCDFPTDCDAGADRSEVCAVNETVDGETCTHRVRAYYVGDSRSGDGLGYEQETWLATGHVRGDGPHNAWAQDNTSVEGDDGPALRLWTDGYASAAGDGPLDVRSGQAERRLTVEALGERWDASAGLRTYRGGLYGCSAGTPAGEAEVECRRLDPHALLADAQTLVARLLP